MTHNKRVFISYSMADRAFADKLRHAMSKEQAEILDPIYNTEAGDKFEDLIRDVLSQSDVFVYIVPEKEGSGKWSLFELGAAKALGKRIVAVLPDSSRVANSEVAARLADLFVVDERSKPSNEIARKILEAA